MIQSECSFDPIRSFLGNRPLKLCSPPGFSNVLTPLLSLFVRGSDPLHGKFYET